jgi:hypothetical protein
MPLKVQKYLIDIQVSILSIKEFLGEKRDFHGYDKVDDVIVWGIICNYLPKLEVQIKKLIRDNNADR